MGVVYLAEHPVIGRQVAVKLLHVSFSKDAEIVARFFNEAKAIHMIHHENIVEILDFGQTADGQPYFIMEFLAGESLADRIVRSHVPPDETIEIGSQICSALQAAHDKGIVHRDLKPHNIHLLEQHGKVRVKILDFGVAKVSGWDAGAGSVKTRTGSLMGTPLYMSPEQCRGSGKLDHRTDIYSLGVILFEMLSGQPPFNAEGVGELFAKHMLEPPPSLLDVAPHTPPHLAAAVMYALNKNLDDRFPSMREFGAALIATDGAVAAPMVRPLSKAKKADGSRAVSIISNAQSTTLSSGASEMEEDDLSAVKSRKGLIAGGVLALAGAAIGVFLLVGQGSRKVAAVPPPPALPAVVPPAAPVAAAKVKFLFDVSPAGAHVIRRVNGKNAADLGEAPVTLEMPAGKEKQEFAVVLSGFREELISASADRDHNFTLSLNKDPVAPRPPKPETAETGEAKDPEHKGEPHKRRPAPGRRPAAHDEDGLAVPSF